MKVAVSSWSFRRALNAGELQLFQVPAACAVLGFALVELNDVFLRSKGRTGRLLSSLGRSDQATRPPDLSPFALGQLEKGLRAAGTQLVCFTADNDFVPENSKALSEQIRYVKAVIGAARYLNCSLVRLWVTRSPTRTLDVAAPTVDAFREVTETASKAGVRLALEHRFSHLEELEAIVYVVEQVRSYYLGACLNFGHLPPNAWRVGLTRLAPYAIHAHAWSRGFDEEGHETTVAYPTCLATLQRINYQGFVSIEYAGSGDPLDGIIATRNLLERSLPQET
jgi:sugar phosphate isomerase/epimerase